LKISIDEVNDVHEQPFLQNPSFLPGLPQACRFQFTGIGSPDGHVMDGSASGIPGDPQQTTVLYDCGK
jgi:hypothetical protein